MAEAMLSNRHTMDADMNTLCEIIGMKRKYKKIINELGYLSTINDTMQSSDLIKQEDRLTADIRAGFLTFIKWKEYNETGTLDEFEEYTEDDEGKKCCEEIEAVLLNPTKSAEEPQMDADMLHILKEIGFTNADRSRLEEGGILTVANLKDNESQLKEKKCCGLMNDIQDRLLIVIKWFDNNPNASPKSFSTKEYEGTVDKLERRKKLVDTYVNMLGRALPNENPYNGYFGLSVQETCKAMDDDPTLFDEAVEEFKSRVLREKASNLIKGVKHFEVDKYLRHIVTIFHDHLKDPRPVHERKGTLISLYGGAQANKTGFEGLNQAIAAVLGGKRWDEKDKDKINEYTGMPTFLVTQGNRECKDKLKKLKDLSIGTCVGRGEIIVVPNSSDTKTDKETKRRLSQARLFRGRGTHIFSDSVAQADAMIEYARHYHNMNPNGHSIMSVDEVDDFIRTEKGSQAFEKKLQELSSVLRPTIVVIITATPIAVMYHMDNVKERFNCEGHTHFFRLNPGEDYIRNEDLRHHPTFLTRGECEKKEPYKTEGLSIPYSSKAQIEFITTSLAPRGLILVCTCPYVNVTGANVFEQAESIQDLTKKLSMPSSERESDNSLALLAEKAMRLTSEEPEHSLTAELVPIVIVVTGESSWGLSVKFPHAKWDKETWKEERFGALLEHIDEKHLETPVMLFGNYKSMGRCFSFRSRRRVPTGMIIHLGTQNIQTLIQLAGRLLGYIKSVLRRNGFENPVLLTTEKDFDTIQNYAKLMDFTIERVENGDTIEQAMHGIKEAIPNELAFFLRTYRELGKIKGPRDQLVTFAKTTPKKVHVGVVQNGTTTTITGTVHTPKVIESLKLLLGKDGVEVHEDTIFQDLNRDQTYRISEQELKSELDRLCDMSLLEELVKEATFTGNYTTEDKQWYNIKPAIVNVQLGRHKKRPSLSGASVKEKKSKGGR